MTDEIKAPSPYDDILDLLLAGGSVDLAEVFERHPGLTAEERRSLQALAHAMRSTGRPSGAGAPRDEAELPFEQIGEFRLVRRLGEGSFGMVFLAEQPSLGRQVAVKILRPGLILSLEADSRLTREAQALARLRHPNIVTAFSFGRDRGVHYLAMEYVAGRGLNEIIAEARAIGNRPTVVQVTGWCRDVARAIQAAHDAGIIHRDVKPSNIRITPQGQAILVDFGLALDRPDSSLTTAGAFRGSPKYSSPEQIESSTIPIDARTDTYSLGVTLYEAVTLQAPFEGPTTESVFARILSGDLEPPRKVAPEIPRELETVILAAIERDRNRRYANAGDFARDLEAILELRDILARPPGLARRVRKWVRRRPVGAALWAAVILAVVTAASVVAVRTVWDRRAFAREAAAASEAAARCAFDDALAAWDRALGLMPSDEGALRQRAETLRRRDQRRAATLLEQAGALLVRARHAREEADKIENDVERLRQEMTGRTLEPDEGRRLARGEGRARTFRFDQETSFHAALNRAHDARALVPDSAEPRDLLADLYMERWREAVVRGDQASQRSYERLVSEHDLAGRHRHEIAGTGSISFDIVPEGAEVHLFRYEEQADVVSDGERRLVPVPINGAPVPVPPGSWCLRVTRPGDVLQLDDLIFELQGRPIEGTLFVRPTKPPIQLFDVLVSVDGRAVDNFADIVSIMNHPDRAETRRTVELEGRNGRYRVEAQSLDELAAMIGPARTTAAAEDFDATIWSRGSVRRAHVPKGLQFRCTAAPLFLSPGCSVGKAPLDTRPAAPGSYLAYVSHRDFEPQRVPFVVERSGHTLVACALRPPGTTPSDYRYVPAGTAYLGRPYAAGTGSVTAAKREVGAFAILDHEVTIGEFLLFLNAADVDEEWKRAPEMSFWSRTREQTMWNQIDHGANGRFESKPGFAHLPASGVSFLQASAYARWLTETAARTDHPKLFAIPSDLEWEKAARGVDGRAYPYGNVFHALWQKSGRSNLRMRPDWILTFPVDESPYGAFDLGGSELEWCDRSAATQGGEGTHTLRGTAWSLNDDRPVFAEYELSEGTAMPETGFRVVIRHLNPDSRPESR